MLIIVIWSDAQLFDNRLLFTMPTNAAAADDDGDDDEYLSMIRPLLHRSKVSPTYRYSVAPIEVFHIWTICVRDPTQATPFAIDRTPYSNCSYVCVRVHLLLADECEVVVDLVSCIDEHRNHLSTFLSVQQ